MIRSVGIHCSYHKCLTGLTARVFRTLWNRIPTGLRRYRHFNSDYDRFASSYQHFTVASVNNHVLEPQIAEGRRISRFLRDPRDLVVSGYFYHRRGAEAWSRLKNPTAQDWMIVNGTIPSALQAGESFAECLSRLSVEEGLLAELEFRTRHFESMRNWEDDPGRILVQRYEDIVDDTPEAFARILSHFGLSGFEQYAVRRIAAHYSSGRVMARSAHVRNPKPSQWKEHFTPAVERAFMDRWGDLLSRYGYSGT